MDSMREVAKLLKKPENVHIIGCLSPMGNGDYKQAVYAKVPYNADAIYHLCRNCGRRETWYLDPKKREIRKNYA